MVSIFLRSAELFRCTPLIGLHSITVTKSGLQDWCTVLIFRDQSRSPSMLVQQSQFGWLPRKSQAPHPRVPARWPCHAPHACCATGLAMKPPWTWRYDAHPRASPAQSRVWRSKSRRARSASGRVGPVVPLLTASLPPRRASEQREGSRPTSSSTFR